MAGRSTQAVPQQAVQQAQAPAAAAPAATTAANDLFTLDFHNPTPPAAQQQPKKDVKQDILSLFSTPAQAAPAMNAFGATAPPAAANVWGSFASAAPTQPVAATNTSMMGNAGTSMWGAGSGWNAPAAPPQNNLWGAPTITNNAQTPNAAQQQSFFNTNDVWASSAPSAPAPGGDLFNSSLPGMAKKDDVFGDIWGGFK